MTATEKTFACVAVSFFLGIPALVMLAMRGLPARPENVLPPETLLAGVPEAARILEAQIVGMRGAAEKSRGATAVHRAHLRLVALHLSAGHIYRDAGSSSEAIRHYVEAKSTAERVWDEQQVATASLALGRLYAASGRLQEAQRELTASYQQATRDGGNVFETAWALANAREKTGHVGEALQLYKEALRAGESNRAPTESLAKLLNDLGEAHHSLDDLGEALKCYQNALEIRNTLTAEDEVAALTYTNLGRAFHDSGNLERADTYYEKALRLDRSRQGANMVATLLGYARVQKDLGESSAVVLGIVERASALLNGAEPALMYSRTMMIKTDLLREYGLFSQAEEHAWRTLDVLRKAAGHAETPEIAIVLKHLGRIYEDQERHKDALDQYSEALTVGLKTFGFFHPQIADAYSNLGRTYGAIGADKAAKRHYERSSQIRQRLLGARERELQPESTEQRCVSGARVRCFQGAGIPRRDAHEEEEAENELPPMHAMFFELPDIAMSSLV